MVWSNWRGALVVVGAWVSLAWTQAFTQSSSKAPTSPTKAERILTLYENGKAIRCRVIGSWKEADGTAYQLQALDSGELITIVEAGTAASSPQGKRTVKTRNFHWGLLNRNPPRGCPTPPEHIMTACEGCGTGPVIQSAGTGPVIVNGGPVVISSQPVAGKDEYIWWEEKNGKPVSPPIVTKGKNPFEENPVLPGSAPALVTTTPSGTTPSGTTPVASAPSGGAPVMIPVSGGPTLPKLPVLPEGTKVTTGATLPPIAPSPKVTPTFTEIELPAPVARTYQTVPGNKRFGDRVRDFFNARPVPTVASRDLPPTTPWKTGTTPTTTTPTRQDRVPFSTAADTSKPKTTGKLNARPLTMGEGDKGTVTPVKGSETAKTEDTPKKDWRTMWGQGTDNTVQQPGQSLVQAAVKPGKGPWSTPSTLPGELPRVDAAKKEDILFNPERFDPKTPSRGIDLTGGTKLTGGTPLPATELPPIAPSSPTGTMPPSVGMAPTGPSSIPLGSTSVIAANSGLQGRVTYVPVPVATVPEPVHPPMPPAPRIPEAPQPAAYVNAFTPPQAPNAMASAPMGRPGMMPAPMGYPPVMPASYPGMAAPMHPGMMQPGMMQPGMVQPGMVQPGMVHPAMMNPAMMQPGMTHPGMMPQGMMPQGMVHPAMMQKPMMPMGYPQAAGTPTNPFNVARTYSGPTPPNPFMGAPQQPIMQASYTPAPAPSATPPTQVSQFLVTLRESLYPAQREWAANQLANFDWRAQPEILPALLTAARHDPAPTVRAGCVYCLSRLNAATQPVMETLQALRGDADPRVRQEVENALVRMGMGR